MEDSRGFESFQFPQALGGRALSDNTVFVTVPASVSYDLDRVNEVTKIVLGKLGCPGCHSGFDIRFQIARRFEFNEKLELLERL